MSQTDTYELNNVDPDEFSDILVKIEKSFGFTFAQAELTNVTTFGKLCDIITNKVQGENSTDCTTQQAFYKLRGAIASALFIDKKSITPHTDLQKLLPRAIRRQSLNAIDGHLGFKTKMLRPKHAVRTWLAFVGLASPIGLFINWQVALTSLVFSLLVNAIAVKLGKELDILTVGQWAQQLSREQYIKSRRNSATINKSEVTQKVKELFMADFGLEEHQLTRNASFV